MEEFSSCKTIVACPFTSLFLFLSLRSTIGYEINHGPIFTSFETLAQFKASRLQDKNVENITAFRCCCCFCFTSMCRSFGCVATFSCTCNSMRFTQCICFETCIQRSKSLKNPIQSNPFIVIFARLGSTYYAVYTIHWTFIVTFPQISHVVLLIVFFVCSSISASFMFNFVFVVVVFSIGLYSANQPIVCWMCAQYAWYRWSARFP